MPGEQRYTNKTTLNGVLLIAFSILLLPAPVIGQTAYVRNGTELTLYLRSISGEAYRQAPPGGLLPVGTDEDIEGFAYGRTSFQLPTFRIASDSITDGEFISVTAADLSQATTLRPSDVAAAISEPRLDNFYLDWLPIAPLFARGRGRQPLGSFVDTGSGRQSIAPGDTLLWERAGTDLEWMKTSRVGNDLFFAASSYSQFSRASSLSLFLYGESEFPVATIDVDAANGVGLILMWMPLVPEPIVVGNSVASDFFLEGQIWIDIILTKLVGSAPQGEVLAGISLAGGTLVGGDPDQSGPAGMAVEIATVSSAAGVWEEFVLARVTLSSLLDR